MRKATSVACDKVISSDWLRQSVLVFLSAENARTELAKLAPDADVPCGSGGAGWALREDGEALFWIVLESKSLPTVAHECVHVVDYLCDFAGIPITAEAVEVRCYLVEWLFSEVAKVAGHTIDDDFAPTIRKRKDRA